LSQYVPAGTLKNVETAPGTTAAWANGRCNIHKLNLSQQENIAHSQRIVLMLRRNCDCASPRTMRGENVELETAWSMAAPCQ
jgi:hypothetical protein